MPISTRSFELSTAKRALLDALLQERGLRDVDTNGPSIARRAHDVPIPLSFAQERLWFLAQLEPGDPSYNLTAAVRLRGELHVPALEKSIAEIVRRHVVLRTTFMVMAGQ